MKSYSTAFPNRQSLAIPTAWVLSTYLPCRCGCPSILTCPSLDAPRGTAYTGRPCKHHYRHFTGTYTFQCIKQQSSGRKKVISVVVLRLIWRPLWLGSY